MWEIGILPRQTLCSSSVFILEDRGIDPAVPWSLIFVVDSHQLKPLLEQRQLPHFRRNRLNWNHQLSLHWHFELKIKGKELLRPTVPTGLCVIPSAVESSNHAELSCTKITSDLKQTKQWYVTTNGTIGIFYNTICVNESSFLRQSATKPKNHHGHGSCCQFLPVDQESLKICFGLILRCRSLVRINHH